MTGHKNQAGAFAGLAQARAREASLELLADRIVERLAADEGFIESLADALAERVSIMPAPSIVDAAGLAEILGITPDTVRRRAVELGGIRPMGGERGRWRFDVERARELWASRSRGERSDAADPALERSSRRSRSRRTGSGTELLAIRGVHEPAGDRLERAA